MIEAKSVEHSVRKHRPVTAKEPGKSLVFNECQPEHPLMGEKSLEIKACNKVTGVDCIVC